MRPDRLFWVLALGALSAHSADGQEFTMVADWPSDAVGGITIAVLDDSGRVFISGASTGWTSIRVHDLRTGARLADLGRAGDGPGEFRQIRGIAVRDSSIAVADHRSYRITVFGGNLQVQSTFPIRTQPVGIGLGATTDGFLLPAIEQGCQPDCRPRLWLGREDEHAQPLTPDPGYKPGAMDHHFLNVGDSVLAMRHAVLGVWMVGPGGTARTIASDSSFSVQTRRDFPSWFRPENGPVGGWVSDGRVFLIHDRYPESQEFPVPSPDGGPPAPVEDRRVSVLRVIDDASGRELLSRQLPMRVRGVLAPGLIWGMEIVGMDFHFRVWEVTGPFD